MEVQEKESASASYFRNFIFGVEDSLVSTVGLLSGVAAANFSREAIFLTGFVLIFVEAFSMAAGSFLSESSAECYGKCTKIHSRRPLISSVIMFFSYFLCGFIPLLPYLMAPVSSAFPLSIIFSLVSLFVLGVVGGKISHTHIWKGGMKMFIVGGIAIAVGVLAGRIVNGL